ncbi:S41 family peptidase [Amycolatopsis echigonensis]|uniref:Peptidase S41-like protein n=1 Tax=Amycolatopsis echigonensis TaxID=2576905 RepID=A0A2N3WVF2_9PSEU|nr:MULTISPECIES: S41 family peptidase [Amycolatopsis]MBB2504782.1 S41 family peptidase [Amycolatopsis echigonensis]PKV97835.1 peptidase S41-like protein [Amycolatopsis niigatensis]
MRRALAAVVALVLLGAGLVAAQPSVPTPPTYLLGALNLLRTHSIDRDRVDWPRAEAEALRAAEGVSTYSGTYPAIRTVLAELGNPHSALLTPAQARPLSAATIEVPSSSVSDGIAVLKIPGFVSDPAGERRYVAAGVAALRAVEAQASCGWIVDLRDDTGGNMWPMLTVLAPLLGDGIAGSFSAPGAAPTFWSVRDGRAWSGEVPRTDEVNPVRLSRPAPPVAVLTSRITASSGEATLIAFRGLGRAATFGGATAGFATANDVFALADGAKLVVTSAVDVDRAGRRYGAWPIAPDHPTPDPDTGAGQWLRGRCA